MFDSTREMLNKMKSKESFRQSVEPRLLKSNDVISKPDLPIPDELKNLIEMCLKPKNKQKISPLD
jgi:hypothetical protein